MFQKAVSYARYDQSKDKPLYFPMKCHSFLIVLKCWRAMPSAGDLNELSPKNNCIPRCASGAGMRFLQLTNVVVSPYTETNRCKLYSQHDH